MRVLLINSNLKSDVLAAPPIGLCYVASATAAEGHEVRVLDLCFRRNVLKEIESHVKDFDPQVVGISIRNIDNCNMLHPRSYLPEVVDIVKCTRGLTDARIVLGGSGASLNPKGVMELLRADFIVVSEGETALPTLLRCLEANKETATIAGLGQFINGLFYLNPPVLKDFSTGHGAVGRWIDMKPYQRMGSSYNIQTRRGCRQQCIYCTYNQVLEGNRLRLRSPVDVVDEIEEALGKHRPESFEFVDSVFNDPIDHCGEILEEIVRRPWKTRFTAMGVSPKGLNGSFLELMRRAGFSSFWITPESASETMIRNYRKGFTADDVISAAEAISRTRFSVLWDFLIGGPGENNRTLQETLDFTLRFLKRDKRPPYYVVNFFVGVRIYPRTRLWEISLEEGFINSSSDPLRQLWYLSSALDLEMAIRQMIKTAIECPEIVSGFDEKYLPLSGVAAFLGNVFKIPWLYWRMMYLGNKFLRKTLLNFTFRPPEIAALLRNQLEHQLSQD